MGNYYTVGPKGGGGAGGIGTLLLPSGNDASDTTAFQEAYDNAVTNKTPLYLGGGTWNIITTITQTFATTTDYIPQIYGSGPGNTILVNATGGSSIFHMTQSANFTYGLGGSLRNLTLKGNGTTGELAVRMRGVWNFSFFNVFFEDFTGGNYVVWYDQPWVAGNGDPTTNANHLFELCRWGGNTGSDCVYCGESDDTTYTSIAYVTFRTCRFVRGASAYRGGCRFGVFEGCQFAYMTDYHALTLDQQFSRSSQINIRACGFEGSVKGEIDATVFGMIVENNRFTGVYSQDYPSTNHSIVQLGNVSRDASRITIRNNDVNYGEIEDAASGGSRVYVDYIDAVNASQVSVEKIVYTQVGGNTFTYWGHTKFTGTTYSSIELNQSGWEKEQNRVVQTQELTDPETFTPDQFQGTYWHIVIGTEGSTPGTPAYTIANPTLSQIDLSLPGRNSGHGVLVCIENGSGYSLTDGNFTWGTEYSALTLPTIPNGDRVFAYFVWGGRAIGSSEKIWQTTDWVVH